MDRNFDSDSSSHGRDEMNEKAAQITQVNTAGTTNTAQTTFDLVHQNNLYDENGQLVLIPAPTRDPRDPINLSTIRKLVALIFLCCFGAMAAAAELILGAMLPVFALQYAGIDPKILLPLTENGGLPQGVDALTYLSDLPNAPPLLHVYLLASMPVLVIGLTNLAFIPVAIAIGRRPVVIGCGIIAIAGATWAGFSQSLASHIVARCLQAFGAGTVESLIPFIIQDMVHVHERNTWISSVFAAQGSIIISIGIASPYLIIYLNWRWVYYITAMSAAFFLVGVVFFMPETRWHRSKLELSGIPRQDSQIEYEPRTWKYDIAIFHGERDWKKGWVALKSTLKTFFYPQIFFITMLNSAMIACAFAAGYTASAALLTKPWSWPFLHLGLALMPTLIASLFVGGLTGTVADKIVNYMARKSGQRLPEYQLLNLILPTICALIGTVIFGIAGDNQDKYPWIMFMFGLGLMTFGFLGANTVGAVYVIECYPQLAGPALVNIASFRCMIAFALSFGISDWVLELGYLHSMLIYTGLIAAFGLFIPVVYKYGPAWRRRWPASQYEY